MPEVQTQTTIVKKTQGAPPPRPEEQPPQASGLTVFDYVEGLKPEDWNRITIYLYQLDPPITKTQGQPAYAFKFARAFDEDEIRQLCPTGREFFCKARRRGQPPLTFPTFALAPLPAAAAGTMVRADQAMITGADPAALKVIENLAEKIASGQNAAQMQKTFEQGQELLTTAYKRAIDTTRTPETGKPSGSIVDTLKDLRAAGLIPDISKPTTLDELVAKLRTDGTLAAKAPEDLVAQMEKIANAANLMGFTRGAATGAGEESFKLILTRNAPAIINGLNMLAEKVLYALTMRYQAGAPAEAPAAAPSEAPREVAPPPAEGKPAAPTAPPLAPPRRLPTPQEVLDGFVKSKVVEMCASGIEPGQAVAWLEIASPIVIQSLHGLDIESVLTFLRSDPVLAPLGKEEARKWVEGFVQEVNAE
jgi:hypothetical protein